MLLVCPIFLVYVEINLVYLCCNVVFRQPQWIVDNYFMITPLISK